VRWSKAPAGGTTSLSGLDDNSVSLVYSVGYEAVYRNGVLLSRTNDYTATNGTSITLIDATITGDIIEVFANQTIPLTDTFSQTVADGRFIKNTLTTTTGDIIYASAANTPARLGIGSTDQVLKVSGGIPAWGAPAAAAFVGCKLTLSANQVVGHNTDTKIAWNQEDFDTDGFHSNTTNNTRVTIPTGKGGKYLFVAAMAWASNATGKRESWLYKNGNSINSYFIQTAVNGQGTHFIVTNLIEAAAGDYIELGVNQNSGGNLNFETIAYFACQYLGA